MLEILKYTVWIIAVLLSAIGFAKSIRTNQERAKTSEKTGKSKQIIEGLKQKGKLLGILLFAFLAANAVFYYVVDIAKANGYIGQNPRLDSLYSIASTLIGFQVIMLTTEKLVNNQKLHQFFQWVSLQGFMKN